MRRPGLTTLARVVAGLLVVAALASCRGGEPDGDGAGREPAPDARSADGAGGRGPGIKPSLSEPEPVRDHPAGLGPLRPPAGFSAVPGEGFTVHAPAEFEPQRRTSSNGEPMLVLTTGGVDETGAERLVGVVRDVEWGRAGVLEQSLVLESAKRQLAGATEVRRTVVDWPGARAAVVVEWTEQKAVVATGASVAVRTVQLSVDVDDALSLSVVAVAPVAAFDQSGVATVLRTFRPAAAAS